MTDTVRIQPYEAPWNTLGAGIYRGLEPAGLQATFNRNGPDALTFDLDGLDQRLPALELAEFTPVDLLGDDGQTPAWGGFIIDTPGRKAGLGVSALGWQYHLDDDPNPLLYVYEGLDRFVDWRTVDAPVSAGFNQNGMGAGEANLGGDKIRLGWPNATPVTAGSFVGVVLDLGPDGPGASCFALTGASSANATWPIYCIAHDNPDWRDGVGRQDAFFQNINTAQFSPAGTQFQLIGTTPLGHRYVTLMLYAATGSTLAADVWFEVQQFQCSALAAYMDPAAGSTGVNVPKSRSVLVASTVFKDQLGECALLSRDYSRIATTVYPIRSLGGPVEEDTPRNVLARADSYHRYRWGIDAQRRGYFQPQPAVPALVVNTADDGVEFVDTSVNSGRDVYNKAVIVGRSGSGRALRRVRLSAAGPGRATSASVPQPANPSATVNLTGWTFVLDSGGATTLVRTTTAGEFTSTPAGFKMDNTSLSPWQGYSWCEVLTPLPAGRLRLRLQLASTYGATDYGNGLNTRWHRILVSSLPSNRVYSTGKITDAGGIANSKPFVERVLDFFHPPDTGDTSYRIFVQSHFDLGDAYFDDVILERVVATTPDKRGFPRTIRLDVAAATDEIAMDLLGDLKLDLSSRPPFKGSLTVTGAVVEDRLSGRRLTPLEVASRAGELVELADVLDPITGQTGRIAAIATGTYARGVATLALDQDRASFEALQARMGA
jgi:hypothetical protein